MEKTIGQLLAEICSKKDRKKVPWIEQSSFSDSDKEIIYNYLYEKDWGEWAGESKKREEKVVEAFIVALGSIVETKNSLK